MPTYEYSFRMSRPNDAEARQTMRYLLNQLAVSHGCFIVNPKLEIIEVTETKKEISPN